MALGASDTTQKIYALKKQENQEILQNASLIVIETNANEYDIFGHVQHSFKTIGRNFELLCKELSNLQIRILFLILPVCIKDENLKKALEATNNLNRIKIKEYGFNFIDMQRYYEDKNLNEFYATTNTYHQLGSLMCELGKNIINHLEFYKESPIKEHFKIPEILVKTPPQMFDCKLECKEFKNSRFCENVYKLDNQTKLQFKEEFKDYCLLSIGMYNNFEIIRGGYSSFILTNQNTKIVKFTKNPHFLFHTLDEKFILDNQSFMCLNTLNESITEGSKWIPKNKTNLICNLKHCGLVHFVLAKKDELFDKQEFEIFEKLKQYGFEVKDFQNLDETQIVEFLSNLNIELPKDYDFSYLIPPVEVYKEIIEEYCARMDPVKLNSLQNKIKTLEFGTATQRIQNHLSYKLGQIMIRNSKSLFGFIKMPYLLMALALIHKEQEKIYKEKIKTNPKFNLPPLESYADYKEALKEKECFTYKLGEAFIKAYKSWYKGGFIKFFFEAKALEREFKSKN